MQSLASRDQWWRQGWSATRLQLQPRSGCASANAVCLRIISRHPRFVYRLFRSPGRCQTCGVYQRAGCSLSIRESTYGGGIWAAPRGVRISQAAVGEIIDATVSKRAVLLMTLRNDCLIRGNNVTARTGSGFHEQDPMGDADMPYSMKTAAGSTAPAAGAAPTSPLVEWIRRGVIGGDEVLTGPYGPAAKAALQRALARGHLSPGICATRCGQAGNSGNATTTAPAARLLPAPAAPGLTRLARQAGPAQAAAAGPPSSPPCRRVVVPRTSRCARRGNPASAPGRAHISQPVRDGTGPKSAPSGVSTAGRIAAAITYVSWAHTKGTERL